MRTCSLALLLLAEILALQLLFDSETIADDTSIASWVLANAHWSVRFSVTFAAAYFILAGSRLVRFRERLGAATSGHRWYWYLVAHLAAYSFFVWLSFIVFQEGPTAPLLAFTWAGCVCVVATTWALSIAAWQNWRRFVTQEKRMIGIAGLTSVIACSLGAITNSLWNHLASYTLWTSYGILACIFDNVTCDADQRILGAAEFSVQISPECSGYEGMGIVAVFLGVYIGLYRSHLKLPNAYLLPVIGAAASWCGNALRIAALIVIGASISPDLALAGFHTQAGWILICTIALCLVAVSRRVRFFANDLPPNTAAPASARHTDAYLMPFLAGLASGMLTEALGLDSSHAYVVHTCVLLAILLCYRSVYLQLPRHRSWQSVGIGFMAFILWRFLVAPPAGDADSSGAMAMNRDSMWFFAQCIWYAALIPIAEELAFRKYLIDRLRSLSFGWSEPCKIWISVGVSATCFGLLHGAHWIPGIAAGILFGIAYLRRESVLDAVIAHAVCNSSVAAYAVLTESWWLWG